MARNLAIVATLAALLLLVLPAISGCTADPQVITRTQTVTVQVPVPQRREPPAELLDCGRGLPAPVFEGAAGGLLLREAERPALEALVGGLARCGDAWRAWALEP